MAVLDLLLLGAPGASAGGASVSSCAPGAFVSSGAPSASAGSASTESDALAVLGLVQFRRVIVLDTDAVVFRNIDHLARAPLDACRAAALDVERSARESSRARAKLARLVNAERRAIAPAPRRRTRATRRATLAARSQGAGAPEGERSRHNMAAPRRDSTRSL